MTHIQALLASPHKAIKAGIITDIIDANHAHDVAWPKDRRWFCAACTSAHIVYEDLAALLELTGYPRPSMGDHAYRSVIVGLLSKPGATLASVVAGAGGDTDYLEGLVRQ